MKFTIVRSRRFTRDIEDFTQYASAYSEAFFLDQFARLNKVLTVDLADKPGTWNYFFLTGAPYRAYLFRVGRRTSYWIVYRIDQTARRVDLLRFWNASRQTETFEI